MKLQEIYDESEKNLKVKYTSIQSLNAEIERQEFEIERQGHILNELRYEKQIELNKYRIECVNRVLDFVRQHKGILKNAGIDTYLCHCQNMLNGNIDGTVLHLEDLKEE